MEAEYKARIHTTAGGYPITVVVIANDTQQARRIIESRPDFKGFFDGMPTKVQNI